MRWTWARCSLQPEQNLVRAPHNTTCKITHKINMRDLLVINPNTSSSVSALLQRHVEAALADWRVTTVTARFGAPYISDEAGYAVAAHAALDAWAAAVESGLRPQAVLIGCFGDPGLFALRGSSPSPVGGLAEAAFMEASRYGRFAIVTGGERWKPMLQRLAQALGQDAALAGVHTVAPTGAELAADPVSARALLAQACRDAADIFGVQAVVLGGAGLAGMASEIQPAVGVPVIDSVLAGARWVAQSSSLLPANGQRRAPGFEVAWEGLSAEMTSLGKQR